MAYFSQEDKKKVAPKIKEVLKKYRVKGTLAVSNHSTLVVNIKSGALDFLGADLKLQQERHDSNDAWANEPQKRDYVQVNRYYVEEWHRNIGETEIADFFKELIDAMKGADWFDKSDSMTDYFHTAYYMDINVGQWNKPYQLTK